MNKILRCFWGLLGCVSFLSCNVGACSNSDESYNSGLSIVCWNLQTFFDGNTSGCEYQEFKNSENWNEERYKQRLSRLCDFITTTKADIFVFEELENAGILVDVYNQLAGDSWDAHKMWNYGTFAKEPGSAIGVGVMSRVPLEGLKLHAIDIRTQKENQPSCRPIVEITVVDGEKSFRLFVNHWKSKSSGIGDGEIWRQWQEASLFSGLASKSFDSSENEQSQNFVVCGDFNKDILTFSTSDNSEQCKIRLRGITSPTGVSSPFVKVKSPWFNNNGFLITQKGTYYYKDTWERIDHFFAGDSVQIKSFRILDEHPWTTEEGIPNLYKVYSGDGYSDHFPLICNVFF